MKFVDEFRDTEKAKTLTNEIHKIAARLEPKQTRPLQLMEFCGGHTTPFSVMELSKCSPIA